jgi:hypothetical protein
MSAGGLSIHTGTATIFLSAGTGDSALTVGADLAGLADSTALATVSAIGLDVDTGTGAVGLTEGTGDSALTIGADITGFAGITTLAAVKTVVLKGDTGVVAIGQTLLAGGFASSFVADFTSFAEVSALATVTCICLKINALSRAFILTGATGKLTKALIADLADFAEISTLATMDTAGFEVVTTALTGILAPRTGDCTLAISADFTLFAGDTAFSAVGAIVAEIGAVISALTIALSGGTFGFLTLAFVAIFIAVTAFKRLRPAKTTSFVDYTALEFTGDLINTADTATFSFLTDGRSGAVWDALVSFAPLIVFADFVILAFRPGIVGLTGLDSFTTGAGAERFAFSGLAGATGFAAIGNTGRFSRTCAVFVFKTFNTALFSTKLTFWTVFVRAADTAIVTGAFLGGAGLALTLFVFQAGNTLTAGRIIADQTSFGAFFTTGNCQGCFSTTASQNQQHPENNEASPAQKA